jgi:hypothetical protein
MPARWVAIGLRGGRELFRVWSGPVADGLEIAPGPDDETAMTDGAALGEGMRWLTDPEAARRAGVLLTVRDADLGGSGRLRDGLDQLVVLGVDWTSTPEAAAAELAALLGGHVYSDGLAFVAQGTPTNNTAEAEAGQTSDRALLLEAFDPARQDAADAVWSAGPRLEAALGLADAGATLAHAPGTTRAEHRVASALLDATWEATAGTYLGQVMRPLGRRRPLVTDDEIDRLRVWASSNLFASGPLPVVRVGRQPYGLLPVVDPNRYQPPAGDRAAQLVRGTTRALRRWWEQAAGAVPRLDRAADPDAALLALLQRSPVAAVARFRRILPEGAAANVVGFDDLTTQQHLHAWLVASMFGGRLVEEVPRIGRFTTDPRDHALRIPWARPAGLEAGAPLPYVVSLRELLGASGGRDRLAVHKATSLAEALLFLSAALELDAAHGSVVKSFADRQRILTSLGDSVRVLHADTIGVGTERAAEPVGLSFESPRALAGAVIPGLTGHRTVAEHVRQELAPVLAGTGTRPGLDGVRRVVTALDRLRGASGEDVEWGLRGLLDLYWYRLDAWLTGLATARLAELRRARPAGSYVGCFGWVEDLRPDPPGRDSVGYVHTPSVAHAVAAAVLRSGHLAHRDAGANVLAIDLSAQRVRVGMAVLDGVETGQPLGALLGYRLERSLRERDPLLMRYVLPLRRLAPLRHTDAELTEPVEAIAARDVVDGVALLERWRAAGGREAVLTAAGVLATHRARVSAVIDEVDDALDAVADLLLSESVYQTVLGNQERARAALAALDRQERPVRPAVVATPRSAATVTHRVLVVLRDGAAPGWPADPRSAAEPRLNAWAARLLGPPGTLVFAGQVRRGAAVRATVSVTAAELGLSPLALLLAARRAAGDQPSELEARLARVLAAKVANPAEEDRLVLLAEPPANSPAGTWGLAAVRSLATWFERVAGRRPAAGGDLGPLLDDQPPGYDVADLAARADRVVAALTQAATRLDAAATGTAAAAVAALALAARLGIVEALPEGPAGSPDLAALRAQVAGVRARVTTAQTRLADAAAAFAARTDPTPELAVDYHRSRLRFVLGDAFPALPLFTLERPGGIAASAADRAALLDGDQLAPLAWLHRVGLVRPAVEPLSSLLTVGEAAGRDLGLPRLDVVQLPHEPDQRWVALPPADEIAQGAAGVVVHAPGGFNPTLPAAGLVIDEWTESIPGRAETTALSFHYDAPAAQPPQAIVLGVTGASSTTKWSLDELLGIARETIALTHLRAVGPRDLPDIGCYLPGLYVPQDVTGGVPGIDLFDLAGRAALPGVQPAVLGKG